MPSMGPVNQQETTATATSLVDVLRARAAAQPEQVAYTWLRDGEEVGAELTYGELDRRARSIAVLLQQCTIPGDRGLLLYPPGLEFIAAFFGCLYAGVVNVPTYPPQRGRRNETVARLRTIAEATTPVVLASSRILASRDNIVATAPELSALHWLDTEAIDTVPADRWTMPDTTGSTLALLQFTSGSTGVPKGTMITHGNLMSNLEVIQNCFGDDSTSRGVSWLPPYHDMGLIGGVLQPIFAGFPVVLMSPISFLQHPIRWLKAISRFQATASGGPNFAYELCLRRVKNEHLADLDLSHWQVAFNGAEPVRADTITKFSTAFAPCGFRRESFYPCYGLAEATLMISGGDPARAPVMQSVTKGALAQGRVVDAAADDPDRDVVTLVGAGNCAPGHRIAIVDPESCLECPPHQVGEIWISGPSVAKGYWQQNGETVETFCAETDEGPFFRTGDLGFLKENELFVTGRLKDLVIINGRNHYPQDIEKTVEQSHPSFQPSSCAVFSIDVDDQERVIVLVETGTQKISRQRAKGPSETPAHTRTDSTDLARLIRRNVAETHDLLVYAVRFLEPGSIPKTTSGKVRRHLCKTAFLAGEY